MEYSSKIKLFNDAFINLLIIIPTNFKAGSFIMKYLENGKHKIYKISDGSQYEDLIEDLSDKAKIMLKLVNDCPGINATSIQQRLKFESKHTFLKYMNQLLDEGLVEFQKSEKDKRQKQFQLTKKGHDFRLLILKLELEESLNYFFKYCEEIFLNFYPEYLESEKWIEFTEKIGYTDNLVESLEKRVLSYIKTSLQNISKSKK